MLNEVGEELCTVAYLSRFIASCKAMRGKFLDHTAVVVELYENSDDLATQRTNWRGFGVASFRLLAPIKNEQEVEVTAL